MHKVANMIRNEIQRCNDKAEELRLEIKSLETDIAKKQSERSALHKMACECNEALNKLKQEIAQ